jgi:hypothetical protein
VRNLQDDFFRAVLFDNALRFEGDVKGASIGNVSNLLWDAQLQVATVTRAIAGDTGFINLRFFPAGVEAGYNITNNDAPDMERSSLARLKSGAVMTLFYEARDENEFLNRVEFETKGVTRYLLRSESVFDEATKKAILVDKGNKYWVQADLKFLFGPRTQFGRVGFRASFQRGALPPVYAFTKAMNFGIVFESNEKSDKKEEKVK